MVRAVFAKFFNDRGTHLAAMIAYFALLSFVPLLFLALALLGLAGQPTESSYLVEELKRAFPNSSISSIVRVVESVQSNATTLGIVGGVLLLWSSLSLFSALESAFNIVFDRGNRPFLRGKGLALLLMVTSLVTLFAALLVASLGGDVLRRYASGVAGDPVFAYAVSILASTVGVFAFLLIAYYRLTNVRLWLRDVLPGAIVATVGLQVTFQALPIYLRLSNNVVAAQAFGGPFILLVWLYVMGNVIVFGAEVNWWFWQREGARLRPPRRRLRARLRLALGAIASLSTRRRARRPSPSPPRG
jgi:membrane protein